MLASFVMIAVVIPSMLAMTNILPVAIGVAALPIQLTLLVLASKSLFPQRSQADPEFGPTQSLPRTGYAAQSRFRCCFEPADALDPDLSCGGLGDLYGTELEAGRAPGGEVRWRYSSGTVLFMLSVCVAAPLMEEILFRGRPLAVGDWCPGTRCGTAERSAAGPPAFRPWLVMGFAVLMSATRGSAGPVVFAGVLTVGLAVVWGTVQRGKRHIRGVYGSAAMFAMVHSAVWPSPIPLFFLGLGLGWCAVRTRGVLVPAMVHGLFNAVSAVYVLRGGTG
ncbi:MAG: CPBP family intramembrane glutamic endopeptidase [Gemmataceae bacterium]